MSNSDSMVEYRPIEGFPAYRVGSDGSVWSCVQHRAAGWYRLKFHTDKKGYARVFLVPSNRRYYVHRLVLEAFVGPCPDGMECRHFPDRNPSNNNLSNLQWGTPVENQSDTLFHGTKRLGTRATNAKLTDDLVLAIRSEYAAGGISEKSLGDKHGVSAHTVHSVLKRWTWKHVS
jgi:hypothetical protein